jgi:hypothetical protein
MGSPIRIRCATSRGRTRRTASRLRRGPVPRRRAFGSGETVARFGVRETIELVRRFFNISGQNSHFASGARAPGYIRSRLCRRTLNARRCGSGSSDSDRTGRRATIIDQAGLELSSPAVGLGSEAVGGRVLSACPLLAAPVPHAEHARRCRTDSRDRSAKHRDPYTLLVRLELVRCRPHHLRVAFDESRRSPQGFPRRQTLRPSHATPRVDTEAPHRRTHASAA